jgi:hypothetical protein
LDSVNKLRAEHRLPPLTPEEYANQQGPRAERVAARAVAKNAAIRRGQLWPDERIVSSAYAGADGRYYFGPLHGIILDDSGRVIRDLPVRDKPGGGPPVSGFWTDKGRFLDRFEVGERMEELGYPSTIRGEAISEDFDLGERALTELGELRANWNVTRKLEMQQDPFAYIPEWYRRNPQHTYEPIRINPGGKGRGADKFNKAYQDPDLEITDLDRQIAEKHNALLEQNSDWYGRDDIGTSTTLQGQEPTSRYAVSPDTVWEVKLEPGESGRLTARDIAAYRTAYLPDLDVEDAERFIGTWWDPKSKEIVFDVSEGTDDLYRANALAKKAAQDGIMDLRPEGGGPPVFLPTDRNMPDVREPTYREALQAALDAGEESFEWGGRPVDTREGAFLEYMGEETQGMVKHPAMMDRVLKMMRQGPHPRELASGAAAFQSARDWYKRSALALSEMFGPDAGRFTAVLAAMSPRTTVAEDFKGALLFWERMNADKARGIDVSDRKWIENTLMDITHIEGNPVGYDEAIIVGSTALNNVERVLKNWDDPVMAYLSGPKVDSFYNNLLQDVDAVTMDTWSTSYLNMNPARVAGRKAALRDLQTDEYRRFFDSDQARRLEGTGREDIAGGIGTVSPGYAVGEVGHRAAADIVNRLAGQEVMDPSGAQAALWSGVKTISEADAPPELSLFDKWKQGFVTPEDVAQAPSFDRYADDPQWAGLLGRAGATLPARQPTVGSFPTEGIVREQDLQHLLRNVERFRQKDYDILSLLAAGGLGSMGARQAGLLGGEQKETPALYRTGRGLLGG